MIQLQTKALIIGAGPVGLFAAYELSLQGIDCMIADALLEPGGQPQALYPSKPIYDIPAYPVISGEELTERHMEQLKPFNIKFHLGYKVQYSRRTTNPEDGQEYWEVMLHPTDDVIKASPKKPPQIILIETHALIWATGNGVFEPQPLVLEQGAIPNLLYSVPRSPITFLEKDIVIFGSGDSAFDWANFFRQQQISYEHSEQRVTLIARSNIFRAAPHTVTQALDKGVEIRVMTKLSAEQGDGQTHVTGFNKAGDAITVAGDAFFCFYGLKSSQDWVDFPNIVINREKRVSVNTENFQPLSSRMATRYEPPYPNLYFIGDCNDYPGKLKLILSGYHEAALMAMAVAKSLAPNGKVLFEYTTASATMQRRLDVEPTKMESTNFDKLTAEQPVND